MKCEFSGSQFIAKIRQLLKFAKTRQFALCPLPTASTLLYMVAIFSTPQSIMLLRNGTLDLFTSTLKGGDVEGSWTITSAHYQYGEEINHSKDKEGMKFTRLLRPHAGYSGGFTTKCKL